MKCAWKFDDMTEAYETSCGEFVQFAADGPTKNGMKYCCYCGRQIQQEDHVKETDTAEPIATANNTWGGLQEIKHNILEAVDVLGRRLEELRAFIEPEP